MARKITVKTRCARKTRDIFGVILNGELLPEAQAEWFQTEPEVDHDLWRIDWDRDVSQADKAFGLPKSGA